MTVYLNLVVPQTRGKYAQLTADLGVLVKHFHEGLVFSRAPDRSSSAESSGRVLNAKRNEARRPELAKFRDGLLVLRDWVLSTGMDPAWFEVQSCVWGHHGPTQFCVVLTSGGAEPEGLVEFLFRECALVTIEPDEPE